jgi:hypothetical protein
MSDEVKRLVSILEARQNYLGGIGHTTMYDLIKRRELVKVNIGRRSFITVESLAAYVDRLSEVAARRELRPWRWCSAGCQRSGEAQMRRLHRVLVRLELDKALQQRHGHHPAMIERIDEQIAERKRAYDHLAGCPQVKERKETK